jgi:hypothetical protein
MREVAPVYTLGVGYLTRIEVAREKEFVTSDCPQRKRTTTDL